MGKTLVAALRRIAELEREVASLRIERDDLDRALCDYQLANIGQEFVAGMCELPIGKGQLPKLVPHIVILNEEDE